jgi:hypothetical protein
MLQRWFQSRLNSKWREITISIFYNEIAWLFFYRAETVRFTQHT